MTITSSPSPDGHNWQHSVTTHSAGRPAPHFTDSLLDIERLSEGSSYPMVTAWQEGADWLISVSLWSPNETPSPEEIASLTGGLAEVIASARL